MLDEAAVQIQSVGDVIRLAVAPVFLLSACAMMLGVLTNRLARVVDRARQFEARLPDAAAAAQTEIQQTLGVLARRARLMNRAVTMVTVCALLVAIVVVTLFLGAFFDFGIVSTIAVLFIAAMCAFVIALLCFLREVFIATAALRIGGRR